MPIPMKPASGVLIGTRARPLAGHRVADDRRARLRRVRLVRVRVREDPGAVAIPERVADHDVARVRARVADGRERGDDVRDRRVAVRALADVVRGVGGARDVVVVDACRARRPRRRSPYCPTFHTVRYDARNRSASSQRNASTGKLCADRLRIETPSAWTTMPCPPRVLAVEDDRVPVDASDREVVLRRAGRRRRRDTCPRSTRIVSPGSARAIASRNRRRVLRDADRRLRRVAARERRAIASARTTSAARRRRTRYALASSSSFFVSAITFCAMCAGTSS